MPFVRTLRNKRHFHDIAVQILLSFSAIHVCRFNPSRFAPLSLKQRTWASFGVHDCDVLGGIRDVSEIAGFALVMAGQEFYFVKARPLV